MEIVVATSSKEALAAVPDGHIRMVVHTARMLIAEEQSAAPKSSKKFKAMKKDYGRVIARYQINWIALTPEQQKRARTAALEMDLIGIDEAAVKAAVKALED